MAAATTGGEATRQRGDPAARLSSAPQATEYWDLTARFDSGHRLFERFLITNEGPGEQTAAAIGYLVHPDGHLSEFRNGRPKGEWKLSPDHLRLDVASSSLDLRAPLRRLAIDSNTQGVKINLQFPAADPPVSPADPAGAKYWTDVLQLSAPMEGTIWVRGMPEPVAVRGTAALTHVWMDEDEASLLQRCIEFFAHTSGAAFYLSDSTTPTGEHRRWLAVERDGRIAYQATDFELVFGPAVPATADPEYPIPGTLLIRNSDITVGIRPERLLLRANPLDAVPQPFRFILSLKSAPQRVWADASVELNLAAGAERAPLAADGQGILAISFLNPLPLP